MTTWDPATCSDPDLLRVYMANVQDKRPDLYGRAFRQLCQITGEASDDPVVLEFWRAVAALEQIYFEESGRKKKASRLRKKEAKEGVIPTLEYLALQKDPTDGFKRLVANGLQELTAEFIVASHASRFSAESVAAAQGRLSEYATPAP